MYSSFKMKSQIFQNQSATTSRADGMRKAPGRGHALLVVADLFMITKKVSSFDRVQINGILFTSVAISASSPQTASTVNRCSSVFTGSSLRAMF
jgi:hypothetical protein